MNLVVSVEDANRDRHPQRIGKRRYTFGKVNRSREIFVQARTGHAKVDRFRLAQSLAPPRAVDALAAAETQLGNRYSTGPCRCLGVCAYADCSGLISFGANRAGLNFPCTNSFAIAIMLRLANTTTSEEEAIWTPGALGIKGPNGGEGPSNGPSGSNGHIVWMKGDGRTTVEAMGHRYGVTRGPATGRGFVRWGRLPGLDYSPVRQEHDMILQPHRPSNVAGEDAYVVIAQDGYSVECHNGASIANDQPAGAGVRRWVPIELGAGRKLVGLVARPPGGDEMHDGLVVADDSGKSHRGRWS